MKYRLSVEPLWDLEDRDMEEWLVRYQCGAVGGFHMRCLSEEQAHAIARDIRLSIDLGLVEAADLQSLSKGARLTYQSWLERHDVKAVRA